LVWLADYSSKGFGLSDLSKYNGSFRGVRHSKNIHPKKVYSLEIRKIKIGRMTPFSVDEIMDHSQISS
jgi:hypothetical protein